MKQTNRLDLLLKLACKQIYNKEFVSSPLSWEISLSSQLRFIEKNRLDILVANQIKSSSVSEEVKLWANNRLSAYRTFRRLLISELNTIASPALMAPILLIKTVSGFPHITSDIDIVVQSPHDFSLLQKKVANHTFPLEIDLHHHISWTKKPTISDSFVWSHTKRIRVEKKVVLVPDHALDVLIRIAHTPFEMGEIRLSDLLSIFAQFQAVDVGELENEARRAGWGGVFTRTVRLINSLHVYLYGVRLTDKYHPTKIPKGISFPHQVHWLLLLYAVVESRSWNKFIGARYVIRDRISLWKQKNIH